MQTRKTLDVSLVTTKMLKTSSKQLKSFILYIFMLFVVFTCATCQKAENAPPCSIDIRRDLSTSNRSQPLYVKPNSSEYWYPNTEGYLQVPQGRSIELICTGPFANVTSENGMQSLNLEPQIRTIYPQCLQDTTFLLNGGQYEFRHFFCAHKVKYTVERTTQGCANNTGETYRVGYILPYGRFLQTYLVCYDPIQIRTHYTQFVIRPARSQTGVKRSSISKAGDYTKINLNHFYSQKNQHAQAAKKFGSEALTYYVDPSTGIQTHLSRGHLAAKADMIYATEQQTTFNYLNVQPQWQTFNGVNWAKAEKKIREYFAENQRSAVCFGGTYGVMHLSHESDNRSMPFFLGQDENNNDIIAVPEQFYRVCTVGSNVGFAIIGINNIRETKDGMDKYLLCDDVSEQVPWLSWIKNDEQSMKYGGMYACRASELVKKVSELPTFLSAVTEMLI